MFFYIFIFFYSIYSILIFKWLYKSLNQQLSFFYDRDPNLPENYKPFERFDRKKWNHFELYFCAIFLLPIRVLMMIIFTISYSLVIKICNLIWKSTLEQTPVQRWIIRTGGNLLARGILFCAGFYYISHKKAKISQFLPEYPSNQEKNGKKAPLIISNHYSWVDIYYFISSKFCPSFLSKKEVVKYPLIGNIAVGLQSVFVTRDNRDDKNQILDLIEERSAKIRSGKNYPQVLIFPEGTTTNGRYLISFKKGAFFTQDPLQIVCLKYNERSFALSYDGIGDIYCFVFTFCQFINHLTVTEFDVFYPDYLNLKKYSDEHTIIYMNTVKQVMLKCMGVQNSEAGFNDKKKYYDEIREKMKGKLMKEKINIEKKD